MNSQRRTVTIVVHRDGEPSSHSVRLPMWLVRATAILSVGFLSLLVVASVVYTPIARTAARVPGLTKEVEHLRSENAQVRELAATLADIEASYDQVRTMLGVDVVPLRAALDETPRVAYPILARLPEGIDGADLEEGRPVRWPLDELGIVTRGLVTADGAGSHSGLDIAVPAGTPIRATGVGFVTEAGNDVEYGLYVRLRHSSSMESMYGHASRLLVQGGDSVMAGQVIALSGSTGRSTAPHLHFEVFRDGASIDPRHMILQEP